jgi:TolB-like protein
MAGGIMHAPSILESWKAISAYLNRSERTCRTWELELGLPVHRLDGSPKARVFAYPEELDRWLREAGSSPSRDYPIAVLPLRNLSSEQGQDPLVDSLTEGLIGELGRAGALRVVSRRSVWRFKDSPQPLAEIVRELGVRAVLDGWVIRSGNQLRISASLYEASPERCLWSRELEKEMHDVLDVQREIVRELAAEIRRALTLRGTGRPHS